MGRVCKGPERRGPDPARVGAGVQGSGKGEGPLGTEGWGDRRLLLRPGCGGLSRRPVGSPRRMD